MTNPEKNQEIERSQIAEIHDGQFAYHYSSYDRAMLDFFESLSLQGGGYTWAALAKAGLALVESEHIDDIEFDPEGEALYAYAGSRKALEELAAVVKRMAAENDFREQCLALAEENGELE